jgi:hypothetical protein
VKNWTTVPSCTGDPVGPSTNAVITATPPFAGMNSGLAVSRMLEFGGAVMMT